MPAGSEIRIVSLGAAASNAHVFQDSFLRVVGGRGAMVSVAAKADAATSVSIQSGSRTIMRDSELSVVAGLINPNMDTDRVATFPAAPGEEIFVSLTAGVGASLTRILLVVEE